jgi:hypothetical protein
MPAINTLSLENRADTPANVDFNPVRIDGNVAWFKAPGNTTLGDKLVSISARTTAGGYRKVILKVMLPVVSTDSSTGVDLVSVARKSHLTMEFSFAPDATEDEMNETVAYGYALLDSSQSLVDPVLTQGASFY